MSQWKVVRGILEVIVGLGVLIGVMVWSSCQQKPPEKPPVIRSSPVHMPGIDLREKALPSLQGVVVF